MGRFHHHRAAFEEVADIVKDDRNLVFVSDDDIQSFHPVDPARLARLRELLGRIGALALRQDGAAGSMTIIYRMADGRWEKGYRYSEQPQVGTNDQPLDQIYASSRHPRAWSAERAIDGHWSLVVRVEE